VTRTRPARDVKPGNILVDAAPGRREHAYLSDFGLSKKSMAASGLTATGTFLGTPDYCAPEQIRGLPVDGRRFSPPASRRRAAGRRPASRARRVPG
jgi:serine/threonine protein kinase